MKQNDLSYFAGKSIFITGATGLIGKNLIWRISRFNKENSSRMIKVHAFVRNPDKACTIFPDYEESGITFVVGDILNPIKTDAHIDFMIHAASLTASRAFVEEPVEVIETAVLGTRNILELAREKKPEAVIYLSSMEVYGTPDNDEPIDEKHPTNLDTMSVRNSYPESKRMCEAMCTSYEKEYGVPVRVIRLTQTFGQGVEYNDTRVFAQFARAVIEGKDIVLHTKGETRRDYLSVNDAVNAIFTVWEKGENGEAYNAANEDTYCSILEMAREVASLDPKKSVKVIIDEQDNAGRGYAPVMKMNLCAGKLRKLGWMPQEDLKCMYKLMIDSMTGTK